VDWGEKHQVQLNIFSSLFFAALVRFVVNYSLVYYYTNLMDLSLNIQFQGEATGTLVVEGTTAQILKSLDLARIKLVLADQVFSLAY